MELAFTLRELFIAILVGGIVVGLLTGCASSLPYWVKTWDGALTHEVVRAPSPWGPSVQGWTVCDKVRRHCTIFITPKACDYDIVLEHELKHKDGFDHPHYRRGFICPGGGL